MCQVDRWQVELSMGSKVVISSLVRVYFLNLGTFTTTIDLCILPMGLYDIVLGIDWLTTH